MTQRLEQVTEASDGSHVAEEARETLREMRRNLGELLREVPRPAQRVAMAVGGVSIEVEWPETDLREARGVGVRGHAADPTPTTEGAAVTGLASEPVRSPLVGTFYHTPEPGARPYVLAGDLVESGQQVGIVEAMKLMNPVEAPCRGRVLKVLVDNAQSVEYDQPLLLLEPVEE